MSILSSIKKDKYLESKPVMKQYALAINCVIKRIFDVVLSVIGIILLSPLFLVIFCLIKTDSKGPALFKQKRLTKNGKEFYILKFRSMYMDSENKGTGLFNYIDDPRVTKIGRKLRDTSMDELPQLINVMLGDLSLVGPRPPVSYELGDFNTLNKRYKKRFQMKAGITGLAQVMGRNNITWNMKVGYDNQYIDLFQKYGIRLDTEILWITMTNMFKRKDIYEVKPDELLEDEEAAKIADEEVILQAHIPD